jgi:hypothetical protein
MGAFYFAPCTNWNSLTSSLFSIYLNFKSFSIVISFKDHDLVRGSHRAEFHNLIYKSIRYPFCLNLVSNESVFTSFLLLLIIFRTFFFPFLLTQLVYQIFCSHMHLPYLFLICSYNSSRSRVLHLLDCTLTSRSAWACTYLGKLLDLAQFSADWFNFLNLASICLLENCWSGKIVSSILFV